MAQTKLNALLGLSGTLPAVSGANLTGISAPTNTYFHADLTSEHTGISDNTVTKVNLNNVQFDTLGSWNTSNKRWISTTTGKYFVSGIVNCYNGNASNMAIASTIIKKNGNNLFVSHLDWRNNYGGYSNGVEVSGIVDMGGTSDYIELFGYPFANSASGLKFAGTPSGVQTSLTIIRIA
jgi:hypothetical protein